MHFPAVKSRFYISIDASAYHNNRILPAALPKDDLVLPKQTSFFRALLHPSNTSVDLAPVGITQPSRAIATGG
jgi:hypothetical protein